MNSVIMDEIKFFQEIGKLKKIKRSGWVIDKIPNPESVSDHIFRSAIMVYILGSRKGDLDLYKAIRMALVHDIGEAVTGDLIIEGKIIDHKKRGFDQKPTIELKKTHSEIGISEEESRERERKAIQKLAKDAGINEIIDLWSEYEGGETPEAQFVKEIDKLEMCLQALEYEKQEKRPIEHYFTGPYGTSQYIKAPMLKKIFQNIMKMRPNV